MHLLAGNKECVVNTVVIVLPKRVGIMADVAVVSKLATTSEGECASGLALLDSHQTNSG